MKAARALLSLVLLASFVAACGDDESTSGSSTSPSSTTAEETTSTTGVTGLEQPAIWPAADVVFTTPEEAATDFVSTVLGVPPELGEFQAGDSRSGEIEVRSRGEGGVSGADMPVRGTLLLRQLGPESSWFVIGAVNDNAAVTSPEALAEVPAGVLTVEGKGRGFEANIVVRAFVAGHVDQELDRAITMGGALETPEPFTVDLDLSAAQPGDTVVILVQGGVGLETDPGEFGAIAVVIPT
jgi:hypothetical protein